MSEKADDSKPCVVVRVADDAERRCAEERLRRLGLFESCVVTTSDLPHAALLQLDHGEPGASATRAFDYQLPFDCSDDALQTAVALLATIAKLRTQLNDAHRTKDDFATLAATDPLTGLPNRRAWDDALARTLPDVAARGAALCIAIIDLDEFKKVNDAHGHAVGDDVLRAAADGLRRAVRRGDLAARLGGDEFGLLLPELPPDAAAAVVERIRKSACDAVATAGLPPTTASVGFATTYAAASAALGRAKQSGRNRTSGG